MEWSLPFQFPFMVNALIISVMLAIPAGLLSCFLVLKGWSLMGDAISHAVLPGVVLAYVLGLPLGLGAFTAGMVCAGLTGWIDENSRVKRDTVMGVVFSGMFGLGIVMYTKIESEVHLDHILFGNMLGVGPEDMWTTGVIAVVVTGLIGFFWRDLLLQAFDEQQARAQGLHVRALHFGMLAAISLTVVAALQAVGIILAIAFLVAPGAIAFLLTKRFGVMLWLSMGIAAICSFVGVYASFFLDSAPAPTIVLLMTAAFIAAFIRATVQSRRATV
ncbi:manganese/iron transport system permease protein [Litoreibacter halocynthiae]|uniref:Manganese/iron transport system permease protein n=1 Tax=Litoreibacter halocynthiae TaxID=1242689 RepID=A0A4R7LPN7_9RHOB|nr:metal ABC transporter permease [Litoreibacter halocynthiae]TDT77449.1 manganese/iron transport system permease protein [Litoreibacter halocynthiae]